MRFGEKVKTLRENKMLTQEKLAADLNISRSLLAKYETGGSIPDDDLIREIAKYFDVEYEEMLGDDIQIKVPFKFVRIYSIIQNFIFYILSFLSISYAVVSFIPLINIDRNWFSIITAGLNARSYIGIITFIISFAALGISLFWKIDKKFSRKMITSLFMDMLFYSMVVLIIFSLAAASNGTNF